MKTTYVSALILSAVVLLSACKKDPKPIENEGKGTVTIQIENLWGMTLADFDLNKWYIHPQSGDSLNIKELKYYLSNFKLKKVDGSYTDVPNTNYFLVDESKPESLHFTLDDIPSGTYVGIEFLIGLDSLTTVNSTKLGALDPANGMFWNDEKGYVFVSVSGNSTTAPNNEFAYQIGGFTGEFAALQKKEFVFGGTQLILADKGNKTVKLIANAARFWHGSVKTSEYYQITEPSAMSKQMATNFGNGFAFVSIE